MVLTLVKLNGGLIIIGKPSTLSPSLKLTIPEPLLTRAKPLYITSSKADHFDILAKGKSWQNRLPLLNQRDGLFIQERHGTVTYTYKGVYAKSRNK